MRHSVSSNHIPLNSFLLEQYFLCTLPHWQLKNFLNCDSKHICSKIVSRFLLCVSHVASSRRFYPIDPILFFSFPHPLAYGVPWIWLIFPFLVYVCAPLINVLTLLLMLSHSFDVFIVLDFLRSLQFRVVLIFHSVKAHDGNFQFLFFHLRERSYERFGIWRSHQERRHLIISSRW